MTIRKDFLIAASAVLVLALPVAAQAQADQPAPRPKPEQSAPVQAAGQPAAAAAAPASPTADAAPTKDYPRCSAKVTDSCMQGGGGSQGKTRHGKSSHHKKAECALGGRPFPIPPVPPLSDADKPWGTAGLRRSVCPLNPCNDERA
jgi:hypothetical protein